MAYTDEAPAHHVSVDPVLFGAASTRDTCDLKLLLVQSADKDHPYHGRWALPSTFVRADESLEEAVERKVQEETGVRKTYQEQLYTFGDPGRVPRSRVITVGYYALMDRADATLKESTDGKSEWFALDRLPSLAFDHGEIVSKAIARLRAKVRYEPVGFNLLPRNFTVAQLHAMYEAVLDRQLDRPNFRRSIFRMNILREVSEEREVRHRPAKIYRYDEKAYQRYVRQGGHFVV